MFVGIPKEIKDHEYRVGATPAMVRMLVEAGHTVLVEKDAGKAIGLENEMYIASGAKIAKTAVEIYKADMIIKVKEPLAAEYPLLKKGQILFCYLHLSSDKSLTQALLDKQVIGIAYETITDSKGRLPLLIPMSEIAGRASIGVGINALQMRNGGRGTWLGGVSGVLPSTVVVLGGGVVGTEAARTAMGLGARVVILDRSLDRLRDLEQLHAPLLQTLYSTPSAIEAVLLEADLLIGAVLIPGKKAPCLVTKEMVKKMKKGSAIIDVAIDQGGCIETARPTCHSNPYYIEHNVVHYCVPNIPGMYARTATQALTNATMEYAVKIANEGEKSLLKDEHIRRGLNLHYGRITNENVAQDHGYAYHAPLEVLKK